jgi:hypothetical protein
VDQVEKLNRVLLYSTRIPSSDINLGRITFGSPWWLVCWPLDPKVAGSKPGQGDWFLRAIKIRSTPSSRMGSKAGSSHVVRFYDM